MVDKTLEESNKEMMEKLSNIRQAKEKIVSKQFLPEKMKSKKEEGDIICSNSGMTW